MALVTGLPTPEPGAEPGDDTGAAILLVEPDRATRKLYARAVGRYWQVVEADSAAAAGRLLVNCRPLAVVMEPYEGTLDEGWSLLRGLRQSANGSRIAVVVCSVVDERRTAYALGATSYLLKPVSPQQLIHALQRAIGSIQSLDKE